MSKIFKDIEFGLIKERELLPILKNYFNDDTIIKLDKNNVFDFKGDKSGYIELKSRHCIMNKYPTTMVGYNKIIKAKELNDYDVYFFFSFDDFLTYWKYDKNYELD